MYRFIENIVYLGKIKMINNLEWEISFFNFHANTNISRFLKKYYASGKRIKEQSITYF